MKRRLLSLIVAVLSGGGFIAIIFSTETTSLPWRLAALVLMLVSVVTFIPMLLAVISPNLYTQVMHSYSLSGPWGVLFRTRPAVYDHAKEAAKRARHDPGQQGIQVTDIGLMAFNPRSYPSMLRESPVPNNAATIRPYIELQSPRGRHSKVRFMVTGPYGEEHYTHEQHDLILPQQTLCIANGNIGIRRDTNPGKTCSLKVYVDGVLLADHRFYWFPVSGNGNQTPIAGGLNHPRTDR